SGAAKRFQKIGEGLMRGVDDPGGAPGTPRAAGTAAKPGFAKADIPAGVHPVNLPPQGSGFGADFPPLLKKAVEKRDVGAYTGALLDVLQVLDKDPKNAGAWTLRAELDNQLSNFPAAIIDTTQALAFGPASARALRARAY